MEDHVKEQSQHFEPDLSIEKAKSVLYIHKAITYENYNPLWKSILSVTSLKEFDTNVYSMFDQQNILVLLYDEIIDSILHIIDRLDLSVDKEKAEDENDEDTRTTDLIFDMRPVKAKDFRFFFRNLVDFLPTTCIGIETMENDTNENEQITAICAHEILSRQKQYCNDLLVSYLQFIKSLTSECIDYDFANYVQVIQIKILPFFLLD
ncbi:unnamed protein product [Rotaria sordida]|uniref:DNA-PKcs N-terminal domain-containing protein n=1 Tax=Rotaria sordida TaxID=392033 RepID=A0A815B6T5_9BILA|nr:unnamed protein product [Rotaria sordida]CAF1545422.1 unnamed protein product [Rotaria sordida]